MTEREQERDAIVAWMRRRADYVERIASHRNTENPDYWRGQAFAYQKAADVIERGAHLSTES